MNEKRTDIKKILEGGYEGRLVSINGWVYEKNPQEKSVSLLVRDGANSIPVFVNQEDHQDLYHSALKIKKESLVMIEGLVFSDNSIAGKYGIRMKLLNVNSSADYPSQEQLLSSDFRFMKVREQKQIAVWGISNTVSRAIRNYLEQKGFKEYPTPSITSMAAEDPRKVFTFQYYEELAQLQQTGELHLETGAIALGKVYYFTPTFRKERLQNNNHLSEFTTIEVAQAFSYLDDMIKLNEELFKEGITKVIEENAKELKILGREPSQIDVKIPFERLNYDEVVKMSKGKKKDGNSLEIEWGENLTHDLVNKLCEEITPPFTVTGIPTNISPFYMKDDPTKNGTTISYDVYVPKVLEMSTGSERIQEGKTLLEKLQKKDLLYERYQWYVDSRQFGYPPIAGLGMGKERFLEFITGLEITDVIPFPRVPTVRPYP